MDNITYVGMDLGAFKTSAMASNGRRQEMPTVVGWAKDMVARTAIGREIVYGDDAFRHRMSVRTVRPFERGVLKYSDHVAAEVAEEDLADHRKAAALLVRHVIDELRADSDHAIFGVIGAPSRASMENKEHILEAASAGFDAVMIVPEPFAVAYGINRLDGTVVVDIGAGTTDICPIFSSFPTEESQETIPLGGDAINAAFIALMQQALPDAELTWQTARATKERFGSVDPEPAQSIIELSVAGTPRPVDVTQPLREACLTIVEPIIESLQRVLAGCDPDFRKQAQQNILLAGGGSQLRGLDRLIEQGLRELGEVKVGRVSDSVYAGAAGALRLAMQIPDDQWQPRAA